MIQVLNTVLQNHKRRAAKAAATRARKKACSESSRDIIAPEVYYCGSCEKVYQEEADENELWIGSDLCEVVLW